jgi:cephalosporin-C deacetylase
MPVIDLPLEQLKTYQGRDSKPADHAAFWKAGLAEMRALDPEVELVSADFQTSYAECFSLYFKGVGGARIHAKYLRPRTADGKKHPAVLQFHGYTGNSGDWTDKLPYVALGYSVFSMDCRGQGGLSEDRGGTKGNTLHGHIIRGLDEGPDHLLFRKVFLDTALLASIALNRPEVDSERVSATGYSQGGALSLVCASLEPRIYRVAPVYPFLCDFRRVWEMDLAKDAYQDLRDYFRIFDPTHQKEGEVFDALAYIDVQHLVDRIRGEVLLTTCLMDPICPPSTQFAAYNKIRSTKRMVLYPDYGHEALPGCNDTIFRFLTQP